MSDLLPRAGWTEERITFLAAHYKHDMSAGQIADAFGAPFTRNAIVGKAKRLGLAEPGGGAARTAGRRRQAATTRTAIKRATNGLDFRSPKPRAPTADPVPAVVSVHPGRDHAARFIDRRHDQCAVILDDDVDIRERLVCGAPTASGSWCAFHALQFRRVRRYGR